MITYFEIRWSIDDRDRPKLTLITISRPSVPVALEQRNLTFSALILFLLEHWVHKIGSLVEIKM
jgi:hypothetical protein